MLESNKSKLFVGLICVAVAFLCMVMSLYFAGKGDQSHDKKLASLEVEFANLIAEKAQGQLKSSDAKRVRRQAINLEDFLSRAEAIYGPDELNRKEGVLWVDRQATTSVVTLGAVNGLKKDSRLNVYDGDAKIGEVIVKFPLDVISYTEPVDMSFDDFAKDYYRVVVAD